jgi:hypothetical protein
MQFEVKGHPYFLNFVPSEGRWFMYVPSVDGMHRIPVADDDHMHFDKFVVPPTEDKSPVM